MGKAGMQSSRNKPPYVKNMKISKLNSRHYEGALQSLTAPPSPKVDSSPRRILMRSTPASSPSAPLIPSERKNLNNSPRISFFPKPISKVIAASSWVPLSVGTFDSSPKEKVL